MRDLAARPWPPFTITAVYFVREVELNPLQLVLVGTVMELTMLILGIAFFAGASTESIDRLWEAHVIRDVGLPGIGSLEPELEALPQTTGI